MADEAPANATTSTTNPTTKKKISRRFDVSGVIIEVLSSYTGKGGMSSFSLKKALVARGCNMEKNRRRFTYAIIQLVNQGIVLRITGTGARGHFKINKKKATNPVQMDKEVSELVYYV
ncbi:uncharacterized protein V6R79_023331 [Siganus canaliculatus]